MKSVILVGGGASIKEGIELGLWEKIKGQEIWSINFAFLTMPYLPNREVWTDISFFKNNIDILQRLYYQGVSCHAKLHHKYADIPEIKTYETTREPVYSKEKMFIGRMGLSGFFALSLAVKNNYDVVYLLGYDFGSKTTNTHYYQDSLNVSSTGVGHPELYRNHHGEVKEEVKDFELFLQYPTKIYNVSLESKIPYFEKIDYPTFFSKINEKKD
jgi:hypothetical protein